MNNNAVSRKSTHMCVHASVGWKMTGACWGGEPIIRNSVCCIHTQAYTKCWPSKGHYAMCEVQ